ncbi:porin family protein [Xanthocytophaga agilis]|uniref:Porin family protein n=1 Tax=Xanthocytophaga agilis TaxID=3048010 RepID=A0AAE3R6N1_9BACT|nr:porin family protein [Xanthocytophaga agilis]MDJ1501773.1 porin family protein [Xanthocytophaga agilis]
MKKVFLSIAAVAAMVFTAQAQFKITPKVGYTASTWGFSKDVKDEIKDADGKISLTSGFSAGAAFELGVSDQFSIQPEILYTQKGYKLSGKESDGEGGSYDAKMDTKFNYLEIPVLFKASFGDEDALRFFGYVGPYFGYALNGKSKSKLSSGGASIDFTTKIKFGDEPENAADDEEYYSSDDANRLDIGAYVGAGASLPVGPGAISLEARYGYGLTNFYKTPDGGDKKDYKSQTRTIGIFVGYSIPLGGK